MFKTRLKQPKKFQAEFFICLYMRLLSLCIVKSPRRRPTKARAPVSKLYHFVTGDFAFNQALCFNQAANGVNSTNAPRAPACPLCGQLIFHRA
jgi:hypothetical protein